MTNPERDFPSYQEIMGYERRAAQLRAETIRSWTQSAFRAMRHGRTNKTP